MQLVVGAATDVGRVRSVNQDAYLAQAPYYVVADGLGGHQGGEVASAVAIEAIASRVAEGSPDDPEFVTGLVRAANAAVLERAVADPALRGMGTTCTVLAMDGGMGLVAHVGDTRAYLFRDGRLRQLTEDHTLVAQLVRDGQITQDEARTHPVRSSITRALGFDPGLEVDVVTVEASTGDRLLLCSDGLYGPVEGAAIGDVLASVGAAQAAADRLIQLANAGGGDDNITAVVIDVVDTGGDRGRGTDATSTTATTTTTAVAVRPEARRPGATSPAAADPAADAEPSAARRADARPRSRARVAVLLLLIAALGALLAVTAYLLLVAPPPAL